MLMKQPSIKPVGLIANYGIEAAHQGNRTGNNGQIQLWQFLLEMLTEREHRDIISWIGMTYDVTLSLLVDLIYVYYIRWTG